MFIPKRVIFEPASLNYPLGKKLYMQFQKNGTPVSFTSSHNRVTGIPGKTHQEAFREGKNTLVIGVRKSKDFQTCKPSAHFQLPLSTGCAAMCEYCYLMTHMGKKPYLRIYVNVDDILEKALEYIAERNPATTIFEGAATSDPVAVEPYSGSLAKAITFFGKIPSARFRFVTKFTDLDTLLDLEHHHHTRIRFSVNAKSVIQAYEHTVPALEARLKAAQKVAAAGYPLGFMIGPIFLVDNWEQQYKKMLTMIAESLENTRLTEPITLELISHRYTVSAKKRILEIFPKSTLPMNEEQRKFKFGQFGYGKYVYSPKDFQNLRSFFEKQVSNLLPDAHIDYII